MNDTTRSDVNHRYAETAIQKVALVFGIVFTVVGLAGFIPGLTSNIENLQFAGHESGALLLGIFQVSILHNIVHLLFGIAGLAAARTARASRLYLLVSGAIYLVLWLYGLLFSGDHAGNFVPINGADNWLHLFLGIAMLLLGFLVGRDRTAAGTRTGRV